MLPNESAALESAARSVSERLSSHRAARFDPPPRWPRGRGPTPNKRRSR
ncbi:MAG: hypothetical protein QOC94_504 [Actinoplanes sp.]|nr:hypothetical protein [Actinoplanes sp.]